VLVLVLEIEFGSKVMRTSTSTTTSTSTKRRMCAQVTTSVWLCFFSNQTGCRVSIRLLS